MYGVVWTLEHFFLYFNDIHLLTCYEFYLSVFVTISLILCAAVLE